MIRTTRLRRMTLQCRQIFFTDACTLIARSIVAAKQLTRPSCVVAMNRAHIRPIRLLTSPGTT